MIKDLIEKHKLIRRATLLWAILLITTVVIKVFWFPVPIPNGTAMALGSVVGILATVIGFYTHTRGKEDVKLSKDDWKL